MIGVNQVSVKKTSFSFGSEIGKQFKGHDFVEIYLDTKRRKVGFKATDSKITGFKIQRSSERSNNLSSPTITKRLDSGVYNAKIEDGFVVINVPRILKEGREVVKQDE